MSVSKRWFCLLGALGLIMSQIANAQKAVSPDPYANETKAQKDLRMKWWREARFGMFIHWGVYSVPAGVYHGKEIGGIGEWIMNSAKIPTAEYQAYAKEFNPVKYNADEWVKTAKEAGMKYIVITSKHHDGFAMFDSKASKWNIVKATPYKHDPLKDLAAACQKYGLRLGFYYSQAQDWNNPGGAAAGGQWDPAQKGSMDDYIKNVAVPQVKEILSNYGKISVLWWDNSVDMTPERAAPLIEALKLQPGIIHNNRLGGGFNGDSETPEQFIPATGFGNRDWETCMTLNDTWGFKTNDHNWKSTESLIRNLVDIASKGGNYLLNVGPTSEGLMPAPSVERLKQVGTWMKVNGSAIYATQASPFKSLPWGRCTRKVIGGDTTLFLHVFNWPTDGKLLIPGLNNPAKSARLLIKAGALKTDKKDKGLVIEVPVTAPDPISSTVVLTIAGTDMDINVPLLQQNADGSLALKAIDAVTHGDQLKYESGGDHDNLGYWMTSSDWADWQFEIKTPGKFTVSAEIASQGAPSFTIKVGMNELKASAPNTGSYTEYKTVDIGEVEFSAAGKTSLAIHAVDDGWAPINIRIIKLTPVK